MLLVFALLLFGASLLAGLPLPPPRPFTRLRLQLRLRLGLRLSVYLARFLGALLTLELFLRLLAGRGDSDLDRLLPRLT